MNKSRTALALLIIVLFAAIVRLYDLEHNPNGLQMDEAAIALTGYLVRTTGMDDSGTRWPLYPHSLWNPKHPVYMYVSMISTATFGMNRFGARLPSVLFGLLAVIAAFLVGREIRGPALGLAAAALLAVSPWHIHFSRFGVEAPSLPAVFCFGFYFLLRGVKDKPAMLVPGALLMGLTFYSYPVAIVFTPLFLAGFTILYRRELIKHRAAAITAAAVFLIFLGPSIAGFFGASEMDSYFEYTSVTGPYFQKEATEYLSGRDDFISRTVNSSDSIRTAYGFVTNYFGYFSPSFLFLRGDTRSILHGPDKYGVMLIACAPLLLAGIFFSLKDRSKESLLILWWTIIFPVGAAMMTWQHQHSIRSIVALPGLQLICAYGIISLLDRFKQSGKVIGAVATIIVCINFGFFYHYYFTGYKEASANFFNYGMDHAFEMLEANKSELTPVMTDTIPYIYPYVFFHIPPTREQVARKPETNELDLDATYRNIGYYVCTINKCIEDIPLPALVAARPAQVPEGVFKRRKSPGSFRISLVENIRYKNNDVSLKVVKVEAVEE